MFPKIGELKFDTISKTEETSIRKSFIFDFDKGDFEINNGKLVVIEYIAALKIWIEKCLRTEKFRFKIYEKNEAERDQEYGVTIEDLISGYNYSIAFIESEIKREVTEALTRHLLIKSLSEWGIERSGAKLTIKFKVNLVNGQSFNKAVSY